MSTTLAEMGHQQPPAMMSKNNTEAKIIVNGKAKQKISRAVDMIFY